MSQFKHYMTLTVLTTILAVVAARASSAEIDPMPVQTMKKISITATRGAEELGDIPATVTVKEADDIDFELARDIKDLIRYEPGVAVSNTPTRFGLAGFNIRGIDGNRVAMRIDGVRMSDAFAIGSFADARRNLVDLELLKRVEIVRGPASALYGSDAIGGVVSFLTKDPLDVLGKERTALHVKSGYRSDSQTIGAGAIFAAANHDHALSGLLALRHSEGGETLNQGQDVSANNARTQPNPQDRTNDSVLGKVVWLVSATQSLKLTIAHDREKTATQILSSLGRGTGTLANVVIVDQSGDDAQDRTRLTLEHTLASSGAVFDEWVSRIDLQDTEVKQRTYEERYSFAVGPSSTVFRQREFIFDQTHVGLEVLAHRQLQWVGKHRLTVGIEAVHTRTAQQRDGRQTTRSTGAITTNIPPDNFPVRDFPISDTDQYALFTQDQITWFDGAFTLTPGLRLDHYRLKPKLDDIFVADNPGIVIAGLRETSFTPKLSALWTSTNALSLYASYQRGFRSPPYNDVNIGFTNLAFGYTAIPNPNLRPETSDGYELGLRGHFTRGDFSVTGFYTNYEDFIASLVAVGTQGPLTVFQSQNLAQAHIYGAEARAELRPFDHVELRSTLAYARGSGRATAQSIQEPLNSIEPLKGVLGLAYRPSAQWRMEIVGTRVQRPRHVDQTPAQFVPDSYSTLDILGEWQLDERIKLNGGVFNVTDEKYWDWSDVRGVAPTSAVRDRYTRPGINAGLSISARF